MDDIKYINNLPIGVMDRNVWEFSVNQERLTDILRAIREYELAHIEIPGWWYHEGLHFANAILPHKELIGGDSLREIMAMEAVLTSLQFMAKIFKAGREYKMDTESKKLREIQRDVESLFK